MATINDFGIPGIGQGYLQPKQKNKWRVKFANLAGGVDSQPLSLQAITITRPSWTFDKIQLDRYTSRAFIAGKYTFEPVQITFEDDVTGLASQVIQDQVQTQQFLIGAEGAFLATAGEGSLYKFITTLEMMDGAEQVIESWTLEGCFFETIDYTDLDYADGEKVTINVTISYDHARQLLGGYDAGQGVALGGAGRT